MASQFDMVVLIGALYFIFYHDTVDPLTTRRGRLDNTDQAVFGYKTTTGTFVSNDLYPTMNDAPRSIKSNYM